MGCRDFAFSWDLTITVRGMHEVTFLHALVLEMCELPATANVTEAFAFPFSVLHECL